MYGVVMMMALTGGADVPAWDGAPVDHVAQFGDHGQKQYRLFGKRHGCHGGGGGCYGGGYGGCYGGGYAGCYGGGYGGCHGGYAGCYGGGYAGCTGGAYGGGCAGGGAYGGYGGGYGGYAAMPYAPGGYYGASSYGAPPYNGGMTPGYQSPGYQYGLPADQGERGYFDNQQDNLRQNQFNLRQQDINAPAPATIVVHLPADAQLTVDGNSTRSTDSIRTLVSPPLEPGRAYQYTLTAEVTRDGKKVERKRDVTVRAGQESMVSFDLSAEPNPSNR